MEITMLFVGFFIMLIMGAPITFAMAVPGTLVFVLSDNLPDAVVVQKIMAGCDSFTLLAMPFFMLAGAVMSEGGITNKIVNFANSLVGHIRGGLAHTTSLAGMILAGVSGSANADAAALGALLVPNLKKSGYGEGFAVSLVSCCGVLGVVIPPSILMVVYAGVSSMPISKLFMAGIIPGVTMGLVYMVVSYFYAKRRNIPCVPFQGFKHVWETFKKAIWAMIMPAVIIVPILTGICTATESGMIACFYGIVYGFISRNLNFKKLIKCIREAARATAMSMSMIAVAMILGYIMTRLQFADSLVGFMNSVVSSKIGVMFAIMIIMTIMGMFIDSNAAMLMMVPIFTPLIEVYGFDPLHFAMVVLLSMVNGGLTPPVGLVLYIVSSVDHTPLKKVVWSIWPFVGLNIFVLILVMFIPEMVTFIPSLLA